MSGYGSRADLVLFNVVDEGRSRGRADCGRLGLEDALGKGREDATADEGRAAAMTLRPPIPFLVERVPELESERRSTICLLL